MKQIAVMARNVHEAAECLRTVRRDGDGALLPGMRLESKTRDTMWRWIDKPEDALGVRFEDRLIGPKFWDRKDAVQIFDVVKNSIVATTGVY